MKRRHIKYYNEFKRGEQELQEVVCDCETCGYNTDMDYDGCAIVGPCGQQYCWHEVAAYY